MDTASPTTVQAAPDHRITCTVFGSLRDTIGEQTTTTMQGLAAWMQSLPPAPDRESQPLIKLAHFEGGCGNEHLSTVFGVEGDHDAGTIAAAEAAAKLQAAGIAAIIHTTSRHRPDAPRWRVLCALSKPVAPDERHRLAGILNGALGGVLAPESFTASQRYFVGSVAGGQPVEIHTSTGQPIDLVQGIAPTGPPASNSDYKPLGDPALAAPSVELLRQALDLIDPDDLGREEWLKASAAIKQAGWSLLSPDELRDAWMQWCARYNRNSPAENEKLWNSLDETKVGWPWLVKHEPTLKAIQSFGERGVEPVQMGGAPPMPAAVTQARPITATPYSWRDPRTLPPRPWLLGHWVLSGEVTAGVAPGGTGKSTIGTALALSLATSRPLLGQRVHDGPHAVWLFNLEDGIEELERQVGAATIYHDIKPEDCGDRLFLDSGIVQPLHTASENRDGFALNEATFDHLAATIRARNIRAVIVDPFVSSHTVSEASNEAIDAIVKRWKRLAQETGCAVVLIHHTKKLGGRDATAEDGRGAVALRDAARVVLALNKMSPEDGRRLGIVDPTVQRSIIRVDMGKANRAPAERAAWIKLEGQDIGNGTASRPADNVGVAVAWQRPDLLDGFTSDHLRALQERLRSGALRENKQSPQWVGHALAEIAGLTIGNDEHEARIKAALKTWIEDGLLAVEQRDNGKGSLSPFVICGRPVDQMPGSMPPR